MIFGNELIGSVVFRVERLIHKPVMTQTWYRAGISNINPMVVRADKAEVEEG